MNTLLTSGLGLVTGTQPSLATSGQSVIKRFFSAGFEIGFMGLLFLAGGLLIPPFDALGQLGVNLFAVGAPMFGLLKGAFMAMITFAVKYLKLYYPGLWPVTFMLSINPWFIYDLIQTWSPAFPQEGYRIPLTYKSIGGGVSGPEGGPKGRITPVVIGMIIAAFAYGGYKLIDYLPKEITGNAGPMIQRIFLITGGVTAATGGGLTALVAVPEMVSALKGTLASPTAAAPEPTATGSVTTTPAPTVTGPTVPVQTGGTKFKSVDIELPSLEEVSKRLLKQLGAEDNNEQARSIAPLFLSGLGVIVVGGLSLAVLRNRGASGTLTE